MIRTPVAHIDDLSLEYMGHGEKLAVEFARLGPLIGLEPLGCSLAVGPSGKTVFPAPRLRGLAGGLLRRGRLR